MSEIDRGVRVRAFLGKWFTIAVIALLILSVVLGWWAYQVNAVPEVEEEERMVEQWSETTDYNHSAEIINGSVPFEEGEIVTNRPIYYTSLSEELDGTYSYMYTAEEGEISVTTDTHLLIRAGEMEDNEMLETYWEVAEPFDTESNTGLEPGDEHQVDYSVDIIDVLETIEIVEHETGSQEGTVDIRVVSTSDIEGTVEGEEVSQTHESEKIMVVDQSVFRVIEFNLVDENHETVEMAEVVIEPSPVEAYGSIILFIISVMLLVSLIASKYIGYTELGEIERELLQVERDRDRFDEWITTGTFPSEREYEQTVLVGSLEGLIDVAIDTNKRVIEDQQLGVSAVLDDEFIYIYVRPDSPAREWLVNFADTTLSEFEQYGY